MSDIPEWAIERAQSLFSKEVVCGNENDSVVVYRHAFARYIAEHEEPPVDPLLIEAREIWAVARDREDARAVAKAYRNGSYDSSERVTIALAALRRGIEIGKSDAEKVK